MSILPSVLSKSFSELTEPISIGSFAKDTHRGLVDGVRRWGQYVNRVWGKLRKSQKSGSYYDTVKRFEQKFQQKIPRVVKNSYFNPEVKRSNPFGVTLENVRNLILITT